MDLDKHVNPSDSYLAPNSFPTDYKPNPEELKLLAECRKEGTMKGILLGVMCSGGTYQTIKYFNIAPNPRFGYYPKIGAAGFFGFFLGKMLSIPACYEKFKSLSNSPIGDFMRQQKGGRVDRFQIANSVDTDAATATGPAYGENQMNSALDIDVYSPTTATDSYTGSDYRPKADTTDNEQTNVAKPSVSYAELRQQNRSQYVQAQKEKYNVGSYNANEPQSQSSVPVPPPPPTSGGNEKTKYGDVWG